MRFEMGSNESCACGARPLQVAGRKAGIDEPYEWKSSRTGLWGASGASLAPTRQEGGVKVAVHRMRQRYRELLRAEIANTVASPGEVDAEMHHLFNVLAR